MRELRMHIDQRTTICLTTSGSHDLRLRMPPEQLDRFDSCIPTSTIMPTLIMDSWLRLKVETNEWNVSDCQILFGSFQLLEQSAWAAHDIVTPVDMQDSR